MHTSGDRRDLRFMRAVKTGAGLGITFNNEPIDDEYIPHIV